MDFSRTMKYIKKTHKNVETMSGDQIKEMSMDLARGLGIYLKSQGDDVNQLKNQLYQLLTIK